MKKLSREQMKRVMGGNPPALCTLICCSNYGPPTPNYPCEHSFAEQVVSCDPDFVAGQCPGSYSRMTCSCAGNNWCLILL